MTSIFHSILSKSLLKLELLINDLLQSAFKYKVTLTPSNYSGWRMHKKFDLYYYYEGFNTLVWSYVDSQRYRIEEKSIELKTYMNFSVIYV